MTLGDWFVVVKEEGYGMADFPDFEVEDEREPSVVNRVQVNSKEPTSIVCVMNKDVLVKGVTDEKTNKKSTIYCARESREDNKSSFNMTD